jgi:hypothetical protein
MLTIPICPIKENCILKLRYNPDLCKLCEEYSESNFQLFQESNVREREGLRMQIGVTWLIASPLYTSAPSACFCLYRVG